MNRYEYNSFVKCVKFKTAVSHLAKQLKKDNILDQVDLSPEYFQNENNEDFHEFFENEDGTFFRMEIEELYKGYWYIDIGFSY